MSRTLGSGNKTGRVETPTSTSGDAPRGRSPHDATGQNMVSGGSLPREMVERLLSDEQARQVLGVVLATLAIEKSASAVKVLQDSDQAWIREYAAWLQEMQT